MAGRTDALTARKIACPLCGAPRFAYCVAGGVELGRSHPERVLAARGASDLTPGQLKTLQCLHVNPSHYIQPSMRRSLLARQLIVPAPPTVATPGHCQRRPPKRFHPLTDLGRAAIGVSGTPLPMGSEDHSIDPL